VPPEVAASDAPGYAPLSQTSVTGAWIVATSRASKDETRKSAMRSHDYTFWEVDVQADFMLSGGKLYVPGAEKLLPNIRKLTDAARRGEVFLVSHGCFHTQDDPEFKQFPPHCVKGSPGAEFVPEALTDNFVRVENDSKAKLPDDLSKYQQIILEKQTLDIFESRHANALVERLYNTAEFVEGFDDGTDADLSSAPGPARGRVGQVVLCAHGVELYDVCVYGAHRGCGP